MAIDFIEKANKKCARNGRTYRYVRKRRGSWSQASSYFFLVLRKYHRSASSGGTFLRDTCARHLNDLELRSVYERYFYPAFPEDATIRAARVHRCDKPISAAARGEDLQATS